MHVFSSLHINFYPFSFGGSYCNVLGFMLLFIFIFQLLSGILLCMYFNNLFLYSFDSVLYIMYEVNLGWFMSFFHCIGAALFMVLMFCHLFRGYWLSLQMIDSLNYVWLSGVVLFVLAMIEGFIGYMLIWGQMSYWGLLVAIDLIACVGDLVRCSWMVNLFSFSFSISFCFAMHFVAGWLIGISILVHVLVLHAFGSLNPSIFSYSSLICSFYGMIYKDFVVGICLFLFYIYLILWIGCMVIDINNMEADMLSTPDHMVPEFYFLVLFYVISSFNYKLIGLLSVCLFLVALLFY